MGLVLGTVQMAERLGLDPELVDMSSFRSPHLSVVKLRDGEQLLYLRTSPNAFRESHMDIVGASARARQRQRELMRREQLARRHERALEIREMRVAGKSWLTIAADLGLQNQEAVFACLSWEHR